MTAGKTAGKVQTETKQAAPAADASAEVLAADASAEVLAAAAEPDATAVPVLDVASTEAPAADAEPVVLVGAPISDAEAAELPAAIVEGEYIVKIGISGSRDGEPWPGIGEVVTLPVNEGAQYVALGYVTEA